MDFERLYKTCYLQVYSYLMSLCGNSHLAEELTQQTFFKAMRASANARFREDAKVLTWLCAIAKNLYTDALRQQKHMASLPDELATENDLDDKIHSEALSFQIHKVLHSLDEPYKEVFQLRVFGELPFRKIAALFGKSENWARVTYHRAKLKIQERMDSFEQKL